MILKLKGILFSFVILFGLAGFVSGQTFTFECVGDYISGADCPECTGQTTSRLFNGLAIKRSGAYFKNIDCPYIIKQQGNNLIFQELINPNPETVTINLLASGFSTINGFKDSTACMCAAQDSSWIGGGGDPSITNEGILGVAAGGANDALLTSNTSTAVGVTYAGSTTITVTETPAANGGTITFQADTSLLATVNDIRNNTFDTVATYADLRLYDKGQKLIYVSGHGIEGFFERIAPGPADDDGTVIVGDYSWERVYDRSALNVQWFGAVGDSTTDDGAAIQAAIDEAMLRQNTSVYIPAGKYRYTATLQMYKPIGVSIYGAGMDNTYLFPVNVTGIHIRTDSTELVVDTKYGVAEGRDMMFRDFTMIRSGGNSYANQAIGIHILGTFNRKMENVRVEEFFATAGGALGKGIGIKIDNPYDPILAPADADDAVQHNMFENIYINQCDTGMVLRLTNTVNMHNVKIDESKKVGIVLKNGVVWKGGMVQASVNCGIYIVEDPFPIKGVYLDGLHFEQNSRTNPKYGTIYKGSATTLTNFEAVNCRFSQIDSSKIFNLRSVRYANITNNTYAVNLYDTLYFNGCNSIILGNDNYYEATTTSASSNITFLSGNLTVSTEALNGLTLQKDAPGPYALNVGGTAIVDDNLGVGTTGLPARKFHVQGEARITDLTTDTPTRIVGADADGDLGAITVGSGLLLSGGTISTTVPSSVFSTSVALPTVVGNTQEIGVLTHNEGGRAALVSIDVIADVSGLGNVKRYFFPLAFNSTGGAWVKLLPAVSNAVESTTQDFELEMRTNTSGTPTGGVDTVRIVRTGGTAAGNVDVIIQYYGVDIDANTFTSTSNTSTSAVTTTYTEQSIAQAANKVGVNTWQPARALHVEGEVRIADLTTDTPTRLVGADADGDLNEVTLASGLTLPGGVLTPADASATNEAWTIDAETGDTEVISNQTVLFDGAGINTTNYDAGTNTLTVTGTEVDGSVSNEIETFVSTSDATSHTVTLAPGTTSVQLIEGSNVTLTTGGTAANATVTIASTASGGTNYQTLRDDGSDMTQRAAANFESTSDIAFTLVDDAGNNETEINADIPLGAVDLDEIQDISTGVLLGNSTVSPSPPIEITPTGGVEISGTDLQVSTNGITDGMLRQSVGLSVIGRSANSTGNVADIVAGADGDVLRRSGTTLGFGDVDLTTGVSGTLPVGNGGTGATTFVNNRLLTGNGTSPIVDEANLTFDGAKLTHTNTATTGASYDGLLQSGTLTSNGNSVTTSHNRYTLTSANDGTVTGNTQYGAIYGHTIPALTQSSGAYGIFNTLTNSSTAATGQMTSMFFRITENENTTTLNNRYGCRGEALFTGSGSFHNGYGVRGDVTATTTGRWNSGTGFYTAVTDAVTSYGADMVITNNRGTANTQRGIRIQNNVSGSGVVVDNAYGIELLSAASSSGAITTYYGLYQNTIPSGATSYFLYGNQSAARSYLSGALAVGVNSNASKLFVRGTGATSATMAATFENSAGSDILNVRDDQRVGIITATPNRTLEVSGETRITDLVTDTPTKIVGADADGDLDTIGIGAENELHITAGTLGTNFHTTISPATLTTVTNNWNPTGLSTAWIIELSGNGSFVLLTGITAPTFNKSLTLYNNGDNSILLPREFPTSSAGNRFAFEATLFPGKQVEIRYSTSESRWVLKSKDGLYDDVQHLYANQLFQSPVSITTGDFDFWEITSEAAASVVAPTSGVWSGVSVNTGADAGGLGYVSSKEPFFQTDNSSGTVTWAYCKAVIRTPSSLSDGSNDYAIRVGFNAANGGGGATNGMYFQYNHGLVSGNWGTATTNAGNTQLNNSGVAVTTSTVYVLEMYVQPGLAVSFFINGTRVATNDTFVNTGDDMYVSAEIEKSIGTSQRDLQIFTLQGSAALVNQP